MIIERVRARGFGLFESLELELPQHLCVVHGANETGKTTLAEAIFAALYGASDLNGSRRKERHEVARLKPWGGGDFTVAVDVALATGQRLTVVRRLGDRKDDLTVTDRASGEDLVRKGERGAVALDLLTGVSADLFRASVLISDLPIAAIDPQALHERSSNLTASGDETVSVSRALTLIEKQLGEVGRSDQPGQTKIGLAIASRNQLAAQLADITKQRQSTLQDQAAQESAAQLAREQEAALQEARRQQAAIRRWVATERLGALTANRARIEELEQELKPLAALAQIDPKAAEGLKATIAAARTAASQEQERAQSLRQQAAAEPKPPPASPEWVDRAWQELNRPKLAPSPRGAWWPWLASIVLVVAAAALFASGQPAGGAAALVAAVALLAWSRLARPGTTSGSSQQSALAAEAGASELTVDLVRRVETAWATWRRDQESRETWMADAERLEASAQARLELAQRTEADLTRLVGGLGEGADGAEIEQKLRHLAELQEELKAAREAQSRLLDLPESTLAAWQAGSETAVPGDLLAKDAEVKRLEEALHASQVTSQTLARALSRRLGENSDLPELEAAYRRADDQVVRRQRERSALLLAHEILSAVGAEFHREMGPELAKRMGGWLERLSDGRYNQATLEDTATPRITGPGEIDLRSPGQLSQGTQDLVYLSLRLALCELVFPDETMPLIVDEPSAHLDPGRHGRLVSALAEISAHRQVVVLTCHPWERDALAAAGADILEPATDPRVKIRR